jgi:membrane-bound serine protease (ClpP class)
MGLFSQLVMLARRAMIICLVGLALGLTPALAQSQPMVHVIEIKGVINPLTARYLERALAEAEREAAGLLVMRLDTPGGLDTAMREMTQAMLAARVPVVVYVAPTGSRAASAGMFLALAAHVAAMAPGTNIGAAHPVALGGELDETMAQKVAQDAAATARALAAQRGRSTEWAEKAVLESISMTESEALERGLIDIIAVDLDNLLAQLDGREVITPAGLVTLHMRGVVVVAAPMNFAERLLHVITDPNIAYLLLILGMYALIIELQSPGFGLPGATGVIALALAFVALGNLPLNWAGLGLIVLGVILLLVEAFSPGFGVAGVAGLVMFALGSLMLYRPFFPVSPTLPAVTVNPWLVAAITGGTAALIFFAVSQGLKAQRAPAISDVPRRMMGAIGQATTDLAPVGAAQIGSELWTAVAEGSETIRAGEPVMVIAVEGITVRVRRVAQTLPDTQTGG